MKVHGVFLDRSSSEITKVILSGSHFGENIVSSETLGVGLLNEGSLQIELSLIAHNASILTIDEGERTVNSNISPD